jgi:hypothetical protein
MSALSPERAGRLIDCPWPRFTSSMEINRRTNGTCHCKCSSTTQSVTCLSIVYQKRALLVTQSPVYGTRTHDCPEIPGAVCGMSSFPGRVLRCRRSAGANATRYAADVVELFAEGSSHRNFNGGFRPSNSIANVARWPVSDRQHATQSGRSRLRTADGSAPIKRTFTGRLSLMNRRLRPCSSLAASPLHIGVELLNR